MPNARVERTKSVSYEIWRGERGGAWCFAEKEEALAECRRLNTAPSAKERPFYVVRVTRTEQRVRDA